MMVSFAGLHDGHLDNGSIYRHEVREFVESCVAAGWTSVSVYQARSATDFESLALFSPKGVWFSAAV